jgi:3-methyladenine DNA glycosylase AlkD
VTPDKLNAKEFIARLQKQSSAKDAVQLSRYFKTGKGEYGEGDKFIGVRMGTVFALAKEFIDLPLTEVEKLFDSEIHEARAGAVSILDWQARKKKTPEDRRKELFDLYLKKHDRINNWDLVDRAAIYVIGGYLSDKPRDILYKLAKSKNMWERRTSIISTAYFMMRSNPKDTTDTFKIAEMLLDDKEDLIHKATGWMLRVAGGVDEAKLLKFLDTHAATMPRTALRYALEKLSKEQREHYMKLKVK